MTVSAVSVQTDFLQDESRVMPEPILVCGPWHLVPGKEWDRLDARTRSLVDLFVELFPSAVAAMEKLPPLPEGHAAYVTLGTDEECYEWEMEDNAIGFQAIAARKNEGDEDFWIVNEHSEAVINLSASVRVLSTECDCHAVNATLVTMPHLMARVATWLHASAGRTPLQVFDEGDGELALRAVSRAVAVDAQKRGAQVGHLGDPSDEAEQFGRDLLDRWDRSTIAISEKTQAAIEAFSRHAESARAGSRSISL